MHPHTSHTPYLLHTQHTLHTKDPRGQKLLGSTGYNSDRGTQVADSDQDPSRAASGVDTSAKQSSQKSIAPTIWADGLKRAEKNATRSFVATSFFSQTADKLSMLSLFSLIILFGPHGELLGLSSCLLLLPTILFSLPSGVLADKFNSFRLLNQSLLVRAAVVLALSMLLPQMLDEVQRCLIVGALMVVLSSATTLFDVCRLKVTPKVVRLSHDGKGKEASLAPLVRLNSLFWASLAAATMTSTSIWLATKMDMPWVLLRVSVVLYVLAYFAGSRTETICSAAFRRKEKPAELTFIQYLKRHKRAAKTLFVSAGVGTFSLAFFVCLTLFAWQGHMLSMTMMTKLLPALALGLLMGGLAANANQNVKSGGLTKLTEGLAIVLAVASIAALVTASANTILVAQLGVFALGAAASKSQSLLDTLCQSIFPRQYRGRALGLRNSLQLLPLIFAAVYLERILPAISILPALRVLSITALVFALIMAIVWNDLVFLLCRLFARTVLKIFFHFRIIDKSQQFDGTASGANQWEKRRTIILAGNHTGWLDPLIVGAIFERRTRFLVMDEAMKWPVVGQLASMLGAIPLKRGHGQDAIKAAEECLARGESVLIFPEGRLTKDGNLGEFHVGVARLQKNAQCPIVPFAISGGFEAWPKWRKTPRPASIRIAVGRPLEVKELKDLSQDEIRHRLYDRVKDLKCNE